MRAVKRPVLRVLISMIFHSRDTKVQMIDSFVAGVHGRSGTYDMKVGKIRHDGQCVVAYLI